MNGFINMRCKLDPNMYQSDYFLTLPADDRFITEVLVKLSLSKLIVRLRIPMKDILYIYAVSQSCDSKCDINLLARHSGYTSFLITNHTNM